MNTQFNILDKFYSKERSGILISDLSIKIDPSKSKIVKEWIFQVNRRFRLSLTTFDLTIELFNTVIRLNYLQTKEIQGYIIACNYLASKLLDINISNYDDYINNVNNTYTLEKLNNIEIQILNLINYNTYLPIGSSFISLYLEIYFNEFDKDDNYHIFIESINLYYYNYITTNIQLYFPSIIALSSIYLAAGNIENLSNDDKYMIKIQEIINNHPYYEMEDVLHCSSAISRSEETEVYRHFMRRISTYIHPDWDKEIFKYTRTSTPYDRILRVKHKLYYPKDTYTVEKLEELGEGTYATVYKVKYDGDIKAIKEFRCDSYRNRDGIPWSDLREISILKSLSDSNIVELLEVRSDSFDHLKCYSIVLEYLKQDLRSYTRDRDLTDNQVKRFSLQLLNGVKYLHNLGIIHGDIKPDNILINNEDIKLADFGISEMYCITNNKKDPVIFSLNYRAIELLLNKETYLYEVDIWACGCTIYELKYKTVLFNGLNENEQIDLILRFWGTDKIKNSSLGELLKSINYKLYESHYEKYFEDDASFQDLILWMLEMPEYRLTAEQCINHPWLVIY